MISLRDQLEQVDWAGVSKCINDKGYALVRDLLDIQHANALAALSDRPTGFRKTVDMERYRFGSGTYKYFDHPLPGEIQTIRELVYPKLVPLANLWMEALNIDKAFPQTFEGLRELCRQKGQGLASPLILKYGKGGFNTLHQDLYGDVYFPFQAVLFLSGPEVDYTGGEFVLTQQAPRAQAKAMVLAPHKGDMLIFPTNFRPVKGLKGYYRATMKHGVSALHWGERITLGIIFHDAAS